MMKTWLHSENARSSDTKKTHEQIENSWWKRCSHENDLMHENEKNKA